MPDDKDQLPTIDKVPLARIIATLIIFGILTLLVGIAHIIYPDRVDLVAMVFLEIAFAPIIVILFREIQLSYKDWKFTFVSHTVMKAFDKVEPLLNVRASAEAASATRVAQPGVNQDIADQWAALQPAPSDLDDAPDQVVLVRLRRDIVEALNGIARAYGLDTPEAMPPAGAIISELRKREIIGPREASGLTELIAAGNAQAHGQYASPQVAAYARAEGATLVSALKDLGARTQETVLLQVIDQAIGGGKRPSTRHASSNGLVPDVLISSELLIRIHLPPRVPSDLRVYASNLSVESQQIGNLKDSMVILTRKPAWLNVEQTAPDALVAWATDAGRFEGNRRSYDAASWLFKDLPTPKS